MDGEGNVYVIDSSHEGHVNHRIKVFDLEGRFLREWGEWGDRDGEFKHPVGIAVDGGGNVYVADSGNHRVQVFSWVAVLGLTDLRRTDLQETSTPIPAIPVSGDLVRHATFREGMVLDGAYDELTVNFGGELGIKRLNWLIAWKFFDTNTPRPRDS